MAAKPKNIVYIPGTRIPWMTRKYGGVVGRNYSVLRSRISARIEPTSREAQAINAALTHGIAKSVVADTGITLGAALVAANQGMMEGLVLLDEDIKTTPPTVPRDTNVLRSSWEAENIEKKGWEFCIEAGFSATDEKGHPYAVYVHEMTDEAYGKKIKWKTPGSGPKFLEYGLKRNADNIVKRAIARVKELTSL